MDVAEDSVIMVYMASVGVGLTQCS